VSFIVSRGNETNQFQKKNWFVFCVYFEAWTQVRFGPVYVWCVRDRVTFLSWDPTHFFGFKSQLDIAKKVEHAFSFSVFFFAFSSFHSKNNLTLFVGCASVSYASKEKNVWNETKHSTLIVNKELFNQCSTEMVKTKTLLCIP
jgi:hypothetical protein